MLNGQKKIKGTFISAFCCCCNGKGKPVRRKLFKEAALCKDYNDDNNNYEKNIMMITIIMITLGMIMLFNSDGETCSGNIDSSTRPYSAARALSGKFKSFKSC